MSEPRGPSPAGILATIGVAAAALLCCAGPVLLASGALAGIGGVLRSPWLIGLGAVLAVTVIGNLIARRVRRRGNAAGDACCPPAADRSAGRDTSAPQQQDQSENRSAG